MVACVCDKKKNIFANVAYIKCLNILLDFSLSLPTFLFFFIWTCWTLKFYNHKVTSRRLYVLDISNQRTAAAARKKKHAKEGRKKNLSVRRERERVRAKNEPGQQINFPFIYILPGMISISIIYCASIKCVDDTYMCVLFLSVYRPMLVCPYIGIMPYVKYSMMTFRN